MVSLTSRSRGTIIVPIIVPLTPALGPTVNPINHRPIRPDELAVLKRALSVGPLREIEETLLRSVDSLTVIGDCKCGCRSVYFRAEDSADSIVAEVTALSASDNHFSIMVWANGSALSCLDLVDFESCGLLPDPSTFRA